MGASKFGVLGASRTRLWAATRRRGGRLRCEVISHILWLFRTNLLVSHISSHSGSADRSRSTVSSPFPRETGVAEERAGAGLLRLNCVCRGWLNPIFNHEEMDVENVGLRGFLSRISSAVPSVVLLPLQDKLHEWPAAAALQLKP